MTTGYRKNSQGWKKIKKLTGMEEIEGMKKN